MRRSLQIFPFILALPLAAQTGLPIDQLRVPTPANVLIACTPSGCMAVTLDPSIEIDVATRTIRAAPMNLRDRTEIVKLSAALPAHTLGQPPVALTLVVVRNGLEQSEGEDYTILGRVVTFMAASAPQAGDIVKFRYRW